jgi:large subunit ribosomal protein L35
VQLKVPKQKTKSAAKKRFKITGTGRVLRRHAMQSHNLEKKSAKRGRDFRNDQPVDESDVREVKRLLGR